MEINDLKISTKKCQELFGELVKSTIFEYQLTNKAKTHTMYQITNRKLTAAIKKEIAAAFKGYKFSVVTSKIGYTAIEIYILSAPYAMAEYNDEQINQFNLDKFYSGRKLNDLKTIYDIARKHQVWADVTIGKWNKEFINTGA